jgi:hypothetical protein
MRLLPVVALTVSLTATQTGCASLLKLGAVYTDTYGSVPGGADVYLDGKLRGTSPLQIRRGCQYPQTVEFKMEGYEPETIPSESTFGWHWPIYDVLLTLGIGAIVDAATGCWYDDYGTEYTAYLVPKGQSPTDAWECVCKIFCSGHSGGSEVLRVPRANQRQSPTFDGCGSLDHATLARHCPGDRIADVQHVGCNRGSDWNLVP